MSYIVLNNNDGNKLLLHKAFQISTTQTHPIINIITFGVTSCSTFPNAQHPGLQDVSRHVLHKVQHYEYDT